MVSSGSWADGTREFRAGITLRSISRGGCRVRIQGRASSSEQLSKAKWVNPSSSLSLHLKVEEQSWV